MSRKSIEELFYELETDPLRQELPFSGEMQLFHQRLFNPALARSEKADVLIEWLSSVHYPCLFGRKAAKAGTMSVLILEERDLVRDDDYIKSLVRDARMDWQGDAVDGKKHGLVILAVSERLAYAKPNATVLEISRRLCEMYLDQPITTDVVHRDELFLRIRTTPVSRIRWEVGIDNFAAHGDGRWWHDHRIPGGVAFSMNSVGHMVREMVERALEISSDLRNRAAFFTREKLIQFALPMAMRTILFAQKQSSIPGTTLKARRVDVPHRISSAELERSAAMKGVLEWSADAYEGWYHTDHSLRTGFFEAHSARPSKRYDLDFTYLHAKSELDYRAISIGEEILAILEDEATCQ